MNVRPDLNGIKVPAHVAIIMDGNGRWARRLGKFRIFGHQKGVNTVREICEACIESGVRHLTLYAFSTENWGRPQDEVNGLMDLMAKTIHKELPDLMKNGIRLRAIGDINRLPEASRIALLEGMNVTENNQKLDLILALSYSAKWDLIQAFQQVSCKVKSGDLNPEDITEEIIDEQLSTHAWPHPELLIRTSGEQRLSNFLLWELAYAEFYFTPKHWPEFKKEDFFQALVTFGKRERRFGKTTEQIVPS